MKRIKLGQLFTHPGHRLARFVLVEIDMASEVFTAFNAATRALVEFHFADQDDFRVAHHGAMDSIS